MNRKCASTGKSKYASKLEAELAKADIHSVNTQNRRRKFREEPSRSYRCGVCGGWHLTSRA